MKKFSITEIVLIVAILGAAFAFLRAHDAWKDMQADLAVSQERIKEYEQKRGAAQTEVQQAQKTIIQTDTDTKRKVAENSARLNQVPTTEEVKKMVEDTIHGLHVTQAQSPEGKPMLQVEDTPENRQLIQGHDVAFTNCQFNLEGCAAARAQLEQHVLPALNTQISALQGTNQELEKQNKKLKEFGQGGNIFTRVWRIGFPIGCAGLSGWAASKAKLDPKGVAIATGGGGTVCALALR